MVQLQRVVEENGGGRGGAGGAGGGGGGGGGVVVEEEEELECKICYCPYSLSRRRPKLLHCCHRLCCRCLAQLLALGETPATTVVCPFCRYVTSLPPSSAIPLTPPASLPDDHGLLALLGRNLRVQRGQTLQGGSTELLLTPRTLSSLLGAGNPSFSSFPPPAPGSYASIRGSPNFVVITIMEPPPPPPPPPLPPPPSALSLGRSPYNLRQHRPPPAPPLQAALMYRSASSLDSVASGARRRGGSGVRGCASLLWRGSARALVWLLGLLYFCSLPLGVYLLIMQKTTVGVLLVSLVPTSIMVVIIYGFCQCLCQELWDCIPP